MAKRTKPVPDCNVYTKNSKDSRILATKKTFLNKKCGANYVDALPSQGC